MYRIADMTFEGALRFESDRIFARVPATLTDQQIGALKNANIIEIIDDGAVIASYDIINWASIENDGDALMISWFRCNQSKIANMEEQLSDNAVELGDILDAITELAELITEIIDPTPEPEPDPDPDPDPENTEEE